MSHFAFRLFEQRQRPRIVISRLDGWPAGFPCQRFASHLAMRVRMTRGQGDSPFLPRIGLPPTTTCQFVLAPSNPLFPIRDGIAVPRGGQSRGLWQRLPAPNDDPPFESTRVASLRRTLTPGAQAWAVRNPQRRCGAVLDFGDPAA